MTKIERRTHWEAQVAAFRASGQSVSEWCHSLDKNLLVMVFGLGNFNQQRQWVAVELGDSMDPSCNTLLIRIGDAVIE